jgi:hypothetical protein
VAGAPCGTVDGIVPYDTGVISTHARHLADAISGSVGGEHVLQQLRVQIFLCLGRQWHIWRFAGWGRSLGTSHMPRSSPFVHKWAKYLTEPQKCSPTGSASSDSPVAGGCIPRAAPAKPWGNEVHSPTRVYGQADAEPGEGPGEGSELRLWDHRITGIQGKTTPPWKGRENPNLDLLASNGQVLRRPHFVVEKKSGVLFYAHVW